jgi:hypothetical protein
VKHYSVVVKPTLRKQKTVKEGKIEKHLEEAFKNLDESIKQFKQTNDDIGKAKATFLKHELLVNYKKEELNKDSLMCNDLKQVGKIFEKNNNFQTLAESILI